MTKKTTESARIPQEEHKFGVIETSAKILESPAKETSASSSRYVSWGPSNTFPIDLYFSYQHSSTASAIINGTCEMMKAMPHESLYDDEDSINSYGDSIESLIESLARDYMLFGCFGVQVIFNRLKQVSEIVHLPMMYLRTNEDRDKFFFSKKFGKYTGKMLEYPRFDGTCPERYSSVYYYSNSGHLQTYGISPQSACLADITAEFMASEYIKESLENGLQSRYIINLPDSANLTDNQKRNIEEGIKEKFTGLGSTPFMVYYSSNNEALNIAKIDQDSTPELFNAIRNAAKENIFITNHATPNLFGDPDSTTGFSEQEYDEAFKLYKKMTLSPIMKSVERMFSSVFGKGFFKFTDEAPQTNQTEPTE